MAIQLSDEMVLMTKETVLQDQPCNLISKGILIIYLKTNILLLIMKKVNSSSSKLFYSYILLTAICLLASPTTNATELAILKLLIKLDIGIVK